MPKSPKTKQILVVVTLIVMILSSNHESRRMLRGVRKLSLNLGDGKCKWTPPQYDVPTDINFYKLLVAGYPSGDKRLTYVQLEALSGLPARDEWNFEFEGHTNHPFVKANYPHHEGTWGWKGIQLDSVVLVVRNIKRTLIEYHDILWDIDYAKTYEEAFQRIPNLYTERPPLEDFLIWRDLRTFDEIHWYTWFIDFYLEGGLMRDVFTHEMTIPDQWHMLTTRTNHNSKNSLKYSNFITNATDVTPYYDPMCSTISNGCIPRHIISAEKLISPDHLEARKIAELIHGKRGYDEWMIDEEAWECIWTELIINKKGVKTFIDRKGLREESYGFSYEMLNEMWHELDRIITKYGDREDEIATDLVGFLKEHQSLLGITPSERLSYDELMNYNLEYETTPEQEEDLRRLKETDFMGPRTRAAYNRRKYGNKDSTINLQRRLKEEESYDFSKLDEYVHQRRLELMQNTAGLFGV